MLAQTISFCQEKSNVEQATYTWPTLALRWKKLGMRSRNFAGHCARAIFPRCLEYATRPVSVLGQYNERRPNACIARDSGNCFSRLMFDFTKNAILRDLPTVGCRQEANAKGASDFFR